MKKLLLAIFCFCSVETFSQDIHLSQYLTSPLNLNPALTGMMNEDIRVTTNYRTQWKSVSAEPYKTIAASVDGTIPPKKKSHDFFGVGLVVNTDKAGASNLATNQGNFSLAYNKSLNHSVGSILSMGFQAGAAQKSLSYDALTWDKQYNGLKYDPTLPSGENTTGIALTYLDISLGLNYSQRIGKNLRLSSGASLWHVNKPNISVGRVTEDLLSMKVGVNTLVHYTLPSRPGTSIMPSLVYFQQGAQRLFNVGAAWRYRLVEQSKFTGYYNETALVAGLYYRLKDATFVNVRVDFKGFSFGVNYDFNISTLQVASNSRGGMEFCMMYKKTFLNKQAQSPKNNLRLAEY